jgi:filamentous hemagglutinin family protein
MMEKSMKQLIGYKSRFRILKGGKISLVVSALLGSTTLSFAAPSGGTITSGNANISQNGTVTNITQSSNKASINWQSFSIASNETVNFNQPNSSSITLNRVIGNERSIIDGALNANGQVWLLNSNGVLFGKNASINTAGLLATTSKLSDQDFQNGNYNFTDASSNSVINEGTITISDGGSVILASNEVRNSGTIEAVKGKIHLVGADSYSLNLNGNSLVNLKVDKGVLDALVENSGTIIADGGEIYLTTNAVDELLKGVVNNTGIIEANSLDGLTGHVELFAHGGTGEFGGKIHAKDGFVETSGKYFEFLGADIQAGEWLIDPVDITIDSTLATAIESALGSGDVTITTDGSNTPDTSSGESGNTGDITVANAITWSTAQKLTLDAANDIFINAAVTANGGGQLELLYGQGAANAGNSSNYYVNSIVNLQAGDNFITKLGNDGALNTWKVITDLGTEGSTTGTDLQGINGNLSGNYVLGANIDATNVQLWNSNTGFNPIASDTDPSNMMSFSGTPFSGNFDGLGHTISNLYINKSDTPFVGLFGKVDTGAVVRNIGLTDVDITGKREVGGLVGNSGGLLENVYTTGTVRGTGNGFIVGGVAGSSYDIKDSYSSATVQGASTMGGLTGVSFNLVQNSYATGNVTGTDSKVGGLVGMNSQGTVENSYATGNVKADSMVGGLIGDHWDGPLSNSYASGAVTITSTTDTRIGGLIGSNYDGTITNSYWDSDSSGVANGMGANNNGQSVTAVQSSTATVDAFNEATYTGFDFTNDWFILEGDTRPMLRSQHTNNIANQYELQLISMDKSANYTLNNDIDFGADIQTNQSDIWNIATGFDPIGANFTSRFAGTLTSLGNTFTISNLFIDRASESNIGLIGYAGYGSKISYINIEDADVTGQNYTGILAGDSSADINDVMTSGSVTGNDYTGGVTASFWGDQLTSIRSSASVTGNDYVGGIVATIQTEGGDPMISGLSSSGDVLGMNYVGGVIGSLGYVTLSSSRATGDVTATGDVAGGLVGITNGVTIEDSYATGDVTAANIAGGFVGKNQSSANTWNGNNYYSTSTISRSFATGDVSVTTDKAGGFVGENSTSYSDEANQNPTSATIQNSYSIGSVTGTTNTGGFVGLNDNDGVITDSYYDKTLVTGMSDEESFGKTTEDLKSFTFFDTEGWQIEETDQLSDVYPQLRWMSGTTGTTSPWVIAGPVKVLYTLGTKNSTYNGSSQLLTNLWSASDIFGATYSNWVLGTDYNFLYNDTIITEFTNAGTYMNLAVDILKNGFSTDINLANIAGEFTIAKADATVTANSNSVTYNGSEQSVSGFSATGLVNGETIAVLDGVTGASASGTNAGSYDTSLAGTDENYNLTFVDGTLTINNVSNTTPTTNDSSSSSTSTTTTTQQEEVANIVTPILNSTRTVVNAPQITTPQQVNNPTPRIQAQTTMATNMGLGTNARIVSTTNIGEQADTVVSLGELQQANGGVAGAGGEVRVPLSDNSIVDLVNGGVNLPDGVDQQFFVVANDEN